MDEPPLISLVFLLCFSVYVSFTETAFASVSRNKLKVAADRGDSRAKKALGIIDNIDTAITTLLICNNVTHITIATIVTVFVTKKWGLTAVPLSTVVTSAVIFFAGEMVPKTLGKRYSFGIALNSAWLLAFLMRILKPFALLLTFIGDKFVTKTEKIEEITTTEDEIQDIIEDMAQDGALNEEQSELISSAIQFGDITVGDILTPRVELSAIDIDDNPHNIHDFIKSQSHSRLPVYRGTIDNIIGVLGIRNYMKSFIRSNSLPDIEPLLDKAYCVHSNTEIHELLPLMSKQRINMAVVKDEYGGVLGIITVEDILEELVGDIWDESDEITQSTLKTDDSAVYLDSEIAKTTQKEEKNV